MVFSHFLFRVPTREAPMDASPFVIAAASPSTGFLAHGFYRQTRSMFQRPPRMHASR
jgi:hypothetical protein